MHEVAGRHPGSLVSLGGSGERDFEARLADCATLAVRVAYGVLRNRADAEEVAQTADPMPSASAAATAAAARRAPLIIAAPR